MGKRPGTAIPNRPWAVNREPVAGAYTALVAWQFRCFVVAEMAFLGGLSPGTLKDIGSLARRSRQRHPFFQLQTATRWAGQNGGRPDQQFESFVAVVATVIVDWHISLLLLVSLQNSSLELCEQKKCLPMLVARELFNLPGLNMAGRLTRLKRLAGSGSFSGCGIERLKLVLAYDLPNNRHNFCVKILGRKNFVFMVVKIINDPIT